MKILKYNFYQNKNLWFPDAGILLVLELEDEELELLDWKPSLLEMEKIADFLFNIYPKFFSKKNQILKNNNPLFEIILIIIERVISDFCVKPSKGFLVSILNKRVELFIPCDEDYLALQAWNFAIELISILADLDDGNLYENNKKILIDGYWSLRKKLCSQGLSQISIALAKAAVKRGIPYYRLTEVGQCLQLGQGVHRIRITEAASDHDSVAALQFCEDRLAVALHLSYDGIPVLNPQPVCSIEMAIQAANYLKYPVMLRPRFVKEAKLTNPVLLDDNSVASAFSTFYKQNVPVVVERCLLKNKYYALLINSKLVALVQAIPAQIIGDGQKSVQKLIDELNANPYRGQTFECLLTQVSITEKILLDLNNINHLELNSILEKGKVVQLTDSTEIEQGGGFEDVTAIINDKNKIVLERIAEAVNTDILAIYFNAETIQLPWISEQFAITDVCMKPDLRVYSSAGISVSDLIIDHWFPQGRQDARIPTVGVTGSIGKTTTCRMAASILRKAGKVVGLTGTQGVYVNNKIIRNGDSSNGFFAKNLLKNNCIDVGVFEMARGGLIEYGTILDELSIGVMLNVYDNHTGIDGVNSREDMAKAKRMVTNIAKDFVILNADDSLCLIEKNRLPPEKVCLVSIKENNPFILEHLASGGIVSVLDTTDIKLYANGELVGSTPIVDIPASWGGKFLSPVINALFASAIAYALGIEYEIIKSALIEFQSNYNTNMGRMNLINGVPYKAFMAWADGAQALKEIANFVDSIKISGKKRVILSATGSRPDWYVLESVKTIANSFEYYICSDYKDVRNRKPGEIAELIKKYLIEMGKSEDSIELIPSQSEALFIVDKICKPDDLLMIITYDSAEMWSAFNQIYPDILNLQN